MSSRIVRIGTRGSLLALTQSRFIQKQIEALWPDVKVELTTIKTTGDKIQDVPLAKIGGKGLFVKEIEESLLQKKIDLAVHKRDGAPYDYHRLLHTFRVKSRVKDVGIYRPRHRWTFSETIRFKPPRSS